MADCIRWLDGRQARLRAHLRSGLWVHRSTGARDDWRNQRGVNTAFGRAFDLESEVGRPVQAFTKLREPALGNADLGTQGSERFGANAVEIFVQPHAGGLVILNDVCKPQNLDRRNDARPAGWYPAGMTIRDAKPIPPAKDWFLREWLDASKKRQVDLEKELDWNKSKASLVLRSNQKYTRDEVNEVAAWLGIEPAELLMHPDEAKALRALREAARAIAGKSAA